MEGKDVMEGKDAMDGRSPWRTQLHHHPDAISEPPPAASPAEADLIFFNYSPSTALTQRQLVGSKVFQMVLLMVPEEEEVKPLICPSRNRKREVFDLPRASSGLKKLEEEKASSL